MGEVRLDDDLLPRISSDSEEDMPQLQTCAQPERTMQETFISTCVGQSLPLSREDEPQESVLTRSGPSALALHCSGRVAKNGHHKICVKLMQHALGQSLKTRLGNGIKILTLERFLVLILNGFLRFLKGACRCKCDPPRQVVVEHETKKPEGFPKIIADKMKVYEGFLLALGAGPSLHVNMGLLQAQLFRVKLRMWVYALMILVFHPIVSILFFVLVVSWTTWQSYKMLQATTWFQGIADVLNRPDGEHCCRTVLRVLRLFSVGLVFLVLLLLKFFLFLGVWCWVAGWIPMYLTFDHIDFTERQQLLTDLVRHILLFPAGATAYSALALILLLYTVARNACSMQGVLARWRLLGSSREIHERTASALVSLHFSFAEVWDPTRVWQDDNSVISLQSDAEHPSRGSDSRGASSAGNAPVNRLSVWHIFTRFDPAERSRSGFDSNSSTPATSWDSTSGENAIHGSELVEPLSSSPNTFDVNSTMAAPPALSPPVSKMEPRATRANSEIRERPILHRPLCCFDDAPKPRSMSRKEQTCHDTVEVILVVVSSGTAGFLFCWYFHPDLDTSLIGWYLITWILGGVAGYFVGTFVKGAFQSAHTVNPPKSWSWACVVLALIHGLLPLCFATFEDSSPFFLQLTVKLWAAYTSILCMYLVLWSISASITETGDVARQLRAITSLICRQTAHEFLVDSYSKVEARTPDWDKRGEHSLQGTFSKWSCWSSYNEQKWNEEDQREVSAWMRKNCIQGHAVRQQVRLQELYTAMSFLICSGQGPTNISEIRSLLTKSPKLSISQQLLPMQDASLVTMKKGIQGRTTLGSWELAVEQDKQIMRKINGLTDVIIVRDAVPEVIGQYWCSGEVKSNRNVWIKQGNHTYTIQWSTQKSMWAICRRNHGGLFALYCAPHRDDMIVPEDAVWVWCGGLGGVGEGQSPRVYMAPPSALTTGVDMGTFHGDMAVPRGCGCFQCSCCRPDVEESMLGLSEFVDDFLDQEARGNQGRQGRLRDVVAIFSQLRRYVVMEMITMQTPMEFLLGIVIALLLFLVASLVASFFIKPEAMNPQKHPGHGGIIPHYRASLAPVIIFDVFAITIVISRAMWRCCEVNGLLARHAGLLRTLACESLALSSVPPEPAAADDAADAVLREELRAAAAYAEQMANLIDLNDTKIRLFGLEITYTKVVSLMIAGFSALATKSIALLLPSK